MELTRDQVIEQIKAGLKRRSKLPWSVRGGRGTAYGWLTIVAPPKRQTESGCMTPQDCARLGKLLGFDKPVHQQGEKIASSSNHYREYVDRANGRKPSVIGEAYWD